MRRSPRQTAVPEAFSADWLQQREPFDASARQFAATRLHLPARLAALRSEAIQPWRVIDLACGTGANLRWLAPRLGGAQQWLAVDHDSTLLQRWPASLAAATGTAVRARRRTGLDETLHFSGPGFDAAVVRRQLDLAQRLEALPWPSADLVTASALLDLVSEAWVRRLVALGAAARAALLFALSVDGRHRWTPRDPHDAVVGALFAAHQQRDKGFGPALGAGAAPLLRRALQDAGYRVQAANSDWWLDGRSDARALALLHAMVDGVASAAADQDPQAVGLVRAWQQRRHALAARGSLRVGHVDLLALPAR